MANNSKTMKDFFNNYRVNDEIRGCNNVRLIYKPVMSDDGFNKVVSIEEARRMSRDMELDLIEINGKTNPPIVRLEDYSKFLYELKKQAKAKKKPTTTLKEIQLNTNISDHDLMIKANKAKEFIADGDKVKITLTMKGRELGRREESKKCLYKMITFMEEVAVPESMPRDENNKSIVIMKKK